MDNLFISQPKALGTVGRGWADNCPSYWVDSYVDMINFNNRYLATGKDEFIHYVKGSVSYHEAMRNEMVDKMLGNWLLMLDTDHMFAPDILIRLLAIMDDKKIDVLSGVYNYKFKPHNIVAGDWLLEDQGEDKPKNLGIKPLENLYINQDIQQVGVVPGGCLLVKKKVFDAIKKHFKRAPFDIIQGLSEDYSFCFRCRELGIPIYLAPRVECHHVIPTVLSVKDLA